MGKSRTSLKGMLALLLSMLYHVSSQQLPNNFQVAPGVQAPAGAPTAAHWQLKVCCVCSTTARSNVGVHQRVVHEGA